MPTAAILTGGRARRFDGRDKSALLVDRRTILERQLAELTQFCDDILLVTSPTAAIPAGAPAGVLRGVRLIHDRVAGCGPIGGLDAALASARHDVVVLVACDMPFVTAALLQYLAALTSEADAVVPLTARGYHPLCAAYTRACQAPLARRLAGRQLAMTGLLEDVRVRPVTETELDTFGDRNRLLTNVNTLAEYTRVIDEDRDYVASSVAPFTGTRTTS